MSAQWYEVCAWLMRYWFLALAVLTIYRALRWMLTDESLRRRAIRALPDAGYIGCFEVLSGESRALSPGDEIPLPCEGTLGYSRRCDVCVRHKSLFSREAFFWLEQDGLHMSPIHSGSFVVDGEQVGAGDEAILLSGAQLYIGEVALELRLLKGLQLDDVFEQPLEPYVTPERRKRTKQANKRSGNGKRSLSKKPEGEKAKRGKKEPDEKKKKENASRAEGASKTHREPAENPMDAVRETARPRRARATEGEKAAPKAQPTEKKSAPAARQTPAEEPRRPRRNRLNPPE